MENNGKTISGKMIPGSRRWCYSICDFCTSKKMNVSVKSTAMENWLRCWQWSSEVGPADILRLVVHRNISWSVSLWRNRPDYKCSACKGLGYNRYSSVLWTSFYCRHSIFTALCFSVISMEVWCSDDLCYHVELSYWNVFRQIYLSIGATLLKNATVIFMCWN